MPTFFGDLRIKISTVDCKDIFRAGSDIVRVCHADTIWKLNLADRRYNWSFRNRYFLELSLSTYIVFICVFVSSLKQDFSFKNIQSWKQNWSVALSTVGFCTAWMGQNQILVWSLPNIGLVLEWPPSSLRSFLMRRKNWRCGGGYNDGARELDLGAAAILKQWWWSRNRWSRLIHFFLDGNFMATMKSYRPDDS